MGTTYGLKTKLEKEKKGKDLVNNLETLKKELEVKYDEISTLNKEIASKDKIISDKDLEIKSLTDTNKKIQKELDDLKKKIK